MITIYPAEAPDKSPDSERKVRRSFMRLQQGAILHSVSWQSRRGKRQNDGEADFVVLLPNLGILVLEVKGGGIEIDNGDWYTTGRDGNKNPIKNPFEQAKDSKYALLNYLKESDPCLAQIRIVHGVVFPDIKVEGSLGPNAPRPLIVDRDDLNNPAESIGRIFRHWEQSYPLSGDEISMLIRFLAPTIRVRRLLSDDIADVDSGLLDLTAQQSKVLNSLRRVRRAAIIGGAGTGKTLLAVEKARQLARDGYKTILLCYNAPLKKHLSGVLSDTAVDVETFHTLIAREARKAGLKVPFDPPPTWYELDAVDVLRRSLREGTCRYDAVLIDEAQDFSASWLTAILEMAPGASDLIYLFADSHQDLYQRDWNIPPEFFHYELSTNCRNSAPIAKKVASVFGDDDGHHGNGVSGPEPVFIDVERPSQIVPYVCHLVERLLVDEGIAVGQIVVLVNSTNLTRELRATGVGGHLFTTLEGAGIAVETVHRFKGLERDVVVCAFDSTAVSTDEKAAAYVAMSRAKTVLYLVADKSVRNQVAWDQ
jgi:hypothetical protein